MAKKKLSLKQQKFKKVYLETGNATEAAMQAYDCKDRNSARTLGTQVLAKLSFSELMEEAGLTDKMLIDANKEGLTKSSKSQRDYETGEIIEVADYATRHKYLETALKLKGRGQANTTNNVQVNVQPILQINPEVEEVKE